MLAKELHFPPESDHQGDAFREAYQEGLEKLVQQELETARCHFNMAEDSDLIDCCIHQLTALEKRQNYLLRLLRHSGV